MTNLGMEDDATENIGGTGGVLKEPLKIFFMQAEKGIKEILRNAAGDAKAMLTLESKNICHRVLQLGAMDNLVNALKDEALCINTARIPRNLLIYTEDTRFNDMLLRVVGTAPQDQGSEKINGSLVYSIPWLCIVSTGCNCVK